MRILGIVFLGLMLVSIANAGHFKLQPGEFRTNALQSPTPGVKYSCKAQIHKYDGNQFILYIEKQFTGVSNETSNFTQLPLSFDNKEYEFVFVYNPLGTSGFIGDNSKQESTWFQLKLESQYIAIQNFSSREGKKLPTEFALHASFQENNSWSRIIRVICETSQ